MFWSHGGWALRHHIRPTAAPQRWRRNEGNNTEPARQRLSSREAAKAAKAAEKQQKQVKSTCHRTAGSNVHETRTRVDVDVRGTASKKKFVNANRYIRFGRIKRLIRNEFSGRACVKVKTEEWGMKMSTVHEFPWRSLLRKIHRKKTEKSVRKQKGQLWVRAEKHTRQKYNVENIWLFLEYIFVSSTRCIEKFVPQVKQYTKNLEKW